MTPWVMAHRFAHAISASSRRRGSEDYFFRDIRNFLSTLIEDFDYSRINRKIKNNRYGVPNTKDIVNYFYSLLKFRSAREMSIRNFYEIMYELFAQYIIEGKVELHRPDFIYGPRRVKIQIPKDRLEDFHERLDMLENDLNIIFDHMLSSCTNKIFVM